MVGPEEQHDVPSSGTLLIRLRGPIARSEIPDLCGRLRVLLERTDADLLLYDVEAITAPDCATVDGLARLRLTARQMGLAMQLRHTSSGLHELLELAGLCDVVGCDAAT